MAKYSYSFNEEGYYGEFDTREQAMQAAIDEIATGEVESQRFWTAINEPPCQPEEHWHADDWLEHVSCQDEYSMERADDWDCSTKEQRAELEAEVRAVMAKWLDRHDLRPGFFLAQEVQEHRVPEKVETP